MARNRDRGPKDSSILIAVLTVVGVVLVVGLGYKTFTMLAPPPPETKEGRPRRPQEEDVTATKSDDGRPSAGTISAASVMPFQSQFVPPAAPSADDRPAKSQYPADSVFEAADLMKPAVRDRSFVLDSRPKEEYLAGHIPGAQWVDSDGWAKAFAAGQDSAFWARLIGDLGMIHSTPVVIYDDGSAKRAANVWWILHYWGFEEVRLLDGGWNGWNVQGAPTNRGGPGVVAVRLKLRPVQARLVGKDRMLELVNNGLQQIVDARPLPEFSGDEKKARRNGAIPSAKHLEWSRVIDPHTSRFKSAEELKKLFDQAGIDPAQPAVTYAHSGDCAALMAFTLELMGGQTVGVYYRGWEEWGNADDTSVVLTPKKK